MIDFLEVSKFFGGEPILDGANLRINAGDRVGVVGPNGAGKTTLLRAVSGKLPPKSGSVRLGGGVKLGVLEQNVYKIRAASPLEYIWGLYPKMDQLGVRSLLASVGFRGEDVFISCAGLSGGELARLGLARLSLEHPNFLALDEPTNHLDIYSKDLLYDALRDYTGTLLVITHDRYLMQTLGCAILLIDEGRASFFESYDAFIKSREGGGAEGGEYRSNAAPPLEKRPDPELESAKSAVANAKEQRRQRARDRERKGYVEKRMEELEGDIYDLNEQLALPEVAVDAQRLSEISEALEKNKRELSELEDEWLECWSE